MSHKIPPKPRTPALVTRALVAMSLAVPACGTREIIPSRIGPPPCDGGSGISGNVTIGDEGTPLADVEVTLDINGQTQVYKTDSRGGFFVPTGPGRHAAVSITPTIPGYMIERVNDAGEQCYGPRTMRIVVRAADK